MRDAGLVRNSGAPGRSAVSCDNEFVPSTPGSTRTYELQAGGRTFVVTLGLRALRQDDEGTVLDWSIDTRLDGAPTPGTTITTRCGPRAKSQVPWANVLEALSGIRYEERRFALPARLAPGDQWDSDAVWRSPDGRIREVRHARATGRESCETPRGRRDCLRYEFDLTIADETTGPNRAATTHATGVEWVSEGIGLVRSVIDDGSGLAPSLTLTDMRDP